MKIKNILVSQPKPESEKSPYWDIAKKYDLSIDFFKFIKIEGISSNEFRKTRINILDYTAIILTSKNAVDHFFRICKDMRAYMPDTMKYFCISESTALYLQKYIQYRKRKIFHGKENIKDLMEMIKKHRNEKFLLPCSQNHKEEMPKLLDENKINYKKAILYKTLSNDLSHIDIKKYDMLVFFSPFGIKSLFENFPKFKQKSVAIAAFGSATSKAVKDAKLKLNLTAPSKQAPSMTTAIEQYLQEQTKSK